MKKQDFTLKDTDFIRPKFPKTVKEFLDALDEASLVGSEFFGWKKEKELKEKKEANGWHLGKGTIRYMDDYVDGLDGHLTDFFTNHKNFDSKKEHYGIKSYFVDIEKAYTDGWDAGKLKQESSERFEYVLTINRMTKYLTLN